MLTVKLSKRLLQKELQVTLSILLVTEKTKSTTLLIPALDRLAVVVAALIMRATLTQERVLASHQRQKPSTQAHPSVEQRTNRQNMILQ